MVAPIYSRWVFPEKVFGDKWHLSSEGVVECIHMYVLCNGDSTYLNDFACTLHGRCVLVRDIVGKKALKIMKKCSSLEKRNQEGYSYVLAPYLKDVNGEGAVHSALQAAAFFSLKQNSFPPFRVLQRIIFTGDRDESTKFLWNAIFGVYA